MGALPWATITILVRTTATHERGSSPTSSVTLRMRRRVAMSSTLVVITRAVSAAVEVVSEIAAMVAITTSSTVNRASVVEAATTVAREIITATIENSRVAKTPSTIVETMVAALLTQTGQAYNDGIAILIRVVAQFTTVKDTVMRHEVDISNM